MAGLREFLNSSTGRTVSIGGAIVLVGIAAYVLTTSIGGSRELHDFSDSRLFVDKETGKSFWHKVSIGETVPVKAPGGKNTGFPAEACYWTADGKIKAEPTGVLMPSFSGKPGPTFCPDCGRLVVPYNPKPGPNDKPPPTKDEYEKTHKERDTGIPSHRG